MKTNKLAATMKDRKVILSTLWIFALLNYIYADIFNIVFNPETQSAATTIAQEAVFGFAILMETGIAMVFLSRVLSYGVNRWANIIAGVINTALVGWTLLGENPSFYIFFAAIEIACTVFIIGYAWRWRKPEDQPYNIALDKAV